MTAPLSDEAAIREQVRRLFAAADNWPYEELEPHDYADQAQVVVDIVRPLVGELGTLRARVAELEAAAEKVAAFVADRAEYITAIRGCHDSADYQRWQGHAEARTVLASKLGLPIAWPTEPGEPS